MSKSEEALRREQRLAAKLRENLKRRKGQARARDDADAQAQPADRQDETPDMSPDTAPDTTKDDTPR